MCSWINEQVLLLSKDAKLTLPIKLLFKLLNNTHHALTTDHQILGLFTSKNLNNHIREYKVIRSIRVIHKYVQHKLISLVHTTLTTIIFKKLYAAWSADVPHLKTRFPLTHKMSAILKLRLS